MKAGARQLRSKVTASGGCAWQRGTEEAGVRLLSVQPGPAPQSSGRQLFRAADRVSSLDLHTMMVLGFHMDEKQRDC